MGRLEGGTHVVSTHLSFVPWWNRVQLHTLVRRMPRGDRLVLMGDLNLPPDVAVRTTGLRPLASGLTFPAHAPTSQLDHVRARGLVATSAPDVRSLAVSDHCALSVEVAVG